jgi:uncharacterized membrane protein
LRVEAGLGSAFTRHRESETLPLTVGRWTLGCLIAACLALAGCNGEADEGEATAVGTAEATITEPATINVATAGFRVCNTTTSRVGVAIGYSDAGEWVTEGWWNIAANDCSTIISGPLESRYYYLYAVDADRGGSWTGNAFMCTRDLMFTIRGIEDCVARGYDRSGFVEIDTNLQPQWLVYLSEENRQGVGGR